MKKAVIFDLDGTMWDSSECVTEAYNRGLAKMGYSLRLTVEDVRAAMGKTMTEIAHMYFDALNPEKAEEIMLHCIEEEMDYLKTAGGTLYGGLEETLSALREGGYFVACVSNCQSGYIEEFYAHSGLGGYFDDKECWGGTGKLKADNIRLVIERNGIDRAVYVGDTRGDYDSALAAGAAFVHAAYGYGEVPAGTPKIQRLCELLPLAEKLTQEE